MLPPLQCLNGIKISNLIGKMKIATWNVNSINKRLPLLLDFLRQEDIDVACLQEIKATVENFPSFELELAGYKSCYVCEQGKNGVAILSRHPIKLCDEYLDIPDKEARFLSVKIQKDNTSLKLACIYVPVGGFKDFSDFNRDDKEKWQKKLTFLRALYRYLKKENISLVAGDFNMISSLNELADKSQQNFICCSEQERKIFSEFLKLGYDNVYNTLNPNKIEYSWWNYQFGFYASNIGLRLDHILAKPDFFRFKNIEIKKHPWRDDKNASDHAPIILDCDCFQNVND